MEEVDDRALIHFYKNCLINIVPSVAEGYGLPAIESLSYGAVTICSRISSLIEAARDYAIFFDPDSCEELTHIIKHLLEDQEFYIQMKTKTNTYTSPKWEDSASSLHKIISDLVESENFQL